LRRAVNDRSDQVRWNAAVALAQHGDPAGQGVLDQMLDEGYYSQLRTKASDSNGGPDPQQQRDAMLKALDSVDKLRASASLPRVDALADHARDLQVRSKAREVAARMHAAASAK